MYPRHDREAWHRKVYPIEQIADRHNLESVAFLEEEVKRREETTSEQGP
jgi:hypothetical protein